MAESTALRVMIGICTAVLVAAALGAAQTLFAPVVFAVFAIALVWPLHIGLRRRVPEGIALLVTMLVTLVTLTALALMAAVAFSRAGQWVVGNAAQLQALYAVNVERLRGLGVPLDGVLAGQFDTRWMVRLAQGVLAQLQGIVTFLALTMIYILLGLLEVGPMARQLARLGERRPAALTVLAAIELTAEKLRSYMLVRTLMSLLTGVLVWAFARAMGLELAAEWGVIAFVLNYLPFIGPLVATLFPTLFAALQFGEWQTALVVFLALQVIQNTIGSYIEPRLTGARLAVSPSATLVAVFLGAFVWGLPGALIGVPILIAALTFCAAFPSSAWVADLLSGRPPPERGRPG
jgi:predicted PurR-regulated permease PerM